MGDNFLYLGKGWNQVWGAPVARGCNASCWRPSPLDLHAPGSSGSSQNRDAGGPPEASGFQMGPNHG